MANIEPELNAESRRGEVRTRALFWTVMLLTVLLPIVALSWFAYRIASDSIRSLVVSNNHAIAAITAELVNRDVNRTLQLARILAEQPHLAAAVEQHDIEATRARLASAVSGYPIISRAFVSDLAGNLWCDYPMAPDTHGKNFAHRDWYRGVTLGWRSYISEVYQRDASPRQRVVGVATPIRNGGTVTGILVLQYRLDSLSRWLQQVRTVGTGRVFIVDQSGTLVAHPELDLERGDVSVYQNVGAIQEALQGRSQTQEFEDPITKDRHVGTFMPARVGPRRWVIVAEQSYAEAFLPLKLLRQQLLGGAGILVLGSILVAFGRARTAEQHARLTRRYLRERQLLQMFMDNLPDQIFFKDRNGHYVRVNATMARRFGFREPEQVHDKSDSDFYHPEYVEASRMHEEEIMRTGKARIRYDEMERWPDGRVNWVSITKLPWMDEHGQVVGIFGIATDISERKRVEDALAAKSAELETANHELEAFSYSVSHDLRAPLRAIDGFSKILLEEAQGLTENSRRHLGIVRQGAQQMGKLIDDLLRFSKIGRKPMTKGTVSMRALVDECLEELRNERADRNVTVEVGTLPDAVGDAALLKQVYTNLLSNAFKYTRKQPAALITIGSYENPQRAGDPVYFVSDNGAGFDMLYADKLFRVFQRLHRAEDYEGTGVGLALVQRIVKRHGGRIWVESAPDKGAKFYFTLNGDTDVNPN